MFGTIRRHQAWLWWFIITVIVVSFVVYFSPYTKMNSSGRSGRFNAGSINGERITEEEFYNAHREVAIRVFFQTSRFPDESSRQEWENETYKWLLLVQKEDELGIHVSSEEAAQMARGMLSQFEQKGPVSPAGFVAQVLQPRGMGMEDLERFCRHYRGIQELMAAVGLSGALVAPEDAKALYERNFQQLATEAVFFPASNYLAKVIVLPDALAQFYTNELANYRVPERVQVSYVRFGVSNWLGQAEAQMKTNLNEVVEENFQRLGTNYGKFGKTPDEAKAKIREEVIRIKALEDAHKAAKDFAGRLFRMEPMTAENLDALAKTNGLTMHVTEPFDRDAGPTNLDVLPDFTKVAFGRSASDPFAQPILGRDGAYVIAFHKKLPSEVPSLEAIRARVVADYRLNQAVVQAHQAALTAYTAMTNGLMQGKTFAAVCQTTDARPVELPPISISSGGLAELVDRVNMNQLKQAAFSTRPGAVSSPRPTGLTRQGQMVNDPNEGAFIVYVEARLPLDEAKMRAELPAFTNRLRQQRTQEAFNLWFSREAQKGLRDTPIFQRAQQPANPAPAGS